MPTTQTQPTAEDLDYLTPEEIEALRAGEPAAQADETATAQADDATGDDTTQAAHDQPADDAKTAAEGEGAETTAAADDKADDASAEALQRVIDDADDKPAPTVQTYDGIDKDAFTAERSKLNAEKATALKQLMDGEIDAAAYSAIESRVSDQIAELTSAFTLGEATRQATQRAVQDSIKSLMDRSKGQALDYWADQKAQKQFDQALQLLTGDPDNAGRPMHELVSEADRTVRALRGIGAPAPAPAPTPKQAPAPAAKREVPPTIAKMPAAAPNNVGQDLRDKLATLEGDEAEEFIASLTPAQQKALAQGVAV